MHHWWNRSSIVTCWPPANMKYSRVQKFCRSGKISTPGYKGAPSGLSWAAITQRLSTVNSHQTTWQTKKWTLVCLLTFICYTWRLKALILVRLFRLSYVKDEIQKNILEYWPVDRIKLFSVQFQEQWSVFHQNRWPNKKVTAKNNFGDTNWW